jgi:adenosylcobinamide kinase / adenosylcobinamide-phosphate guanylyltransferase
MQGKRKIVLVLGGARSGKSTFAQKLADSLGGKVVFIATGEPLDGEMRTRIRNHKKNRPGSWRTLEVPRQVGRALEAVKLSNCEVVIIDCITLLISNLLDDGENEIEAEKRMVKEISELIGAIKKISAHYIIVSNEVGLGLVPDNKLGRIYRDLLGKANQILAQQANEVYFLAAGIPLRIKGE